MSWYVVCHYRGSEHPRYSNGGDLYNNQVDAQKAAEQRNANIARGIADRTISEEYRDQLRRTEYIAMTVGDFNRLPK